MVEEGVFSSLRYIAGLVVVGWLGQPTFLRSLLGTNLGINITCSMHSDFLSGEPATGVFATFAMQLANLSIAGWLPLLFIPSSTSVFKTTPGNRKKIWMASHCWDSSRSTVYISGIILKPRALRRLHWSRYGIPPRSHLPGLLT